jgi:peptidoglycan/xylan/chitin deacetylase (PgdA/CDA1 family)
MKAIMYHYVREFSQNLPYFRFLDIENFRSQLDYFEREFGFVTLDEWKKFLNDGAMPSKKGKVLLTFDDATSDHYKYVFPELVSRGLWGIFYVPTQPYTNFTILNVHKIHLLCGAFNGSDIYKYLKSIILEDMIPFGKRQEFKEFTYTNQINYEGVSEFKRTLNYFVDNRWQEKLIDMVAQEFNFKFNVDDFYISTDNIKEMSNNGMMIGSHTVSHPVMSKLSRVDQETQISDSFGYLSSIHNEIIRTFCYPYGGFYSFNEDTISLLNQYKVSFSFNVEDREITSKDFLQSIQCLPRFDCNLFLFGKAS